MQNTVTQHEEEDKADKMAVMKESMLTARG